MTQVNRVQGGQIDRNTPLNFKFDGNSYTGHTGDTLASALLANGVLLMGRSFKYHRPRGPLSAGSEEPNAIVTLRDGARAEPNTRATTAELFDGLTARAQNCWPSVKFDALAVNDAASDFLAAGFYYKTFMWPAPFWEKVYEPIIRKAAGLGALSMKEDPDGYDKGFRHCDLLIVGAGPSGLMAALTAGRAGKEVILADEDFAMGGRLLSEQMEVGGKSALEWTTQAIAELSSLPNVRLMSRTTVIGAFDHGIYGAVERVSDHLLEPIAGKPRQILWRIYSGKTLLCAGAIERPIAFENNDRPGIMLASAMRSYVNRWAATPAQRVAIFTSCDDGHRTAADLHAKGVKIAAVIDTRADTPKSMDYEVLASAHVINTKGRLGLKFVDVQLSDGAERTLECGALGVSGGWNPNVHLTCHQRGRPTWDGGLSAFVPGRTLPPGMTVAGAASGDLSTHGALQSGANGAAEALGIKAADTPAADDTPAKQSAFWYVEGCKRAWLDQQNDVTVKDVKLAHQEGFRSVEHLKRYTTLGMATDQGKTSNMGGLAIMAEIAGKGIPDVGTTIFRPPYTPVSIGALAGRMRGMEFHPTRLTPSHFWAKERGAVFVEVGNWLRAQWFPIEGETHWRQSVDREVKATRASVGVCDCTTLGKIDVQGADAATFLNKVYCNPFAKVAVGKTRYGLMLREDGCVMDDGTASRLGPDHFVMTTTTAAAGEVMRHLDFVSQCLRPDLDVRFTSVTEQWAQFAVAGPQSRALLNDVLDAPLENETWPFMACGDVRIGGVNGRLFRISFSGEHAYEVAVPARYGESLYKNLVTAAQKRGGGAYGMEALNVLRIEKGHITHAEIHGRTTAFDIGFGKMVSAKKDCIGKTMSEREGLMDTDREQLVGLRALDGGEITAGAHVFDAGAEPVRVNGQGYVTSAAFSPTLGQGIGLAFIKNAPARHGEVMEMVDHMRGIKTRVELCNPVFVDPEGGRTRG